MSFLTWAALAIGVLVVAPLAAHLLRRRPPRTVGFAAARFVPPSPAVARRRPTFEDRTLLGIRVVAVVLLALLGATPFIRCDRLALGRRGGASVALAIVLDDSLSMQATLGPGARGRDARQTRFERALAAARELVGGLQSGDAVALVLAGRPARVALGATTELGSVDGLLERLVPSDRATDLDDALRRAAEALRPLPHVDKRVVLLSDRLDGEPGAPPLTAPESVALWAPLEELRAPLDDCGVLEADLVADRVVARVACVGGSRAPRLELRAAGRVVSEATVPAAAGVVEVGLPLRTGPSPSPSSGAPAADGGASAPREPSEPAIDTLVVALTGDDAIAADDAAPVHDRGGALRVGIVADASASRPPTGGPPAVEQAVAALGLGGDLRLLAAVPEQPELLADLTALIVDDVPGFTPEARRVLGSWIEQGGVMLLALGPRAAGAPLGAGFEPMVPGVVRWERLPASSAVGSEQDAGVARAPLDARNVRGIDPASAELFGPSAEGLRDIAPVGRALIVLRPGTTALARARWTDGQPFVLEQRIGRGICYAVGLPLGTDASDLTLRPAFLVLLELALDTARGMGGTSRTPVGATWTFEGYADVRVERLPISSSDRAEPLEVQQQAGVAQVVVARRGAYRIELGDRRARRLAVLDERELLAAPRALPAGATAAELGGRGTDVDVSRYLAFGLLLLLAAELVVRVVQARMRERS